MITRRLVVVTSVVALLGGVAGAVGGALVLAAMSVVAGSPMHGLLEPAFFGVAGLIGFVHGAILGPVLTWALMRDVPLWRAIGETAVAASAMAAVVMFSGFSLIAASAGALGAALLAAARLKIVSRRKARAELPPGPN